MRFEYIEGYEPELTAYERNGKVFVDADFVRKNGRKAQVTVSEDASRSGELPSH